MIEKIIEGFKNWIFLFIKEDFHDGQRLYSPATSGSSINGTHALTNKELQMFKKLFNYKNPEKLQQVLMRADTAEKYKLYIILKPKLVFQARD